MKSKCKPKRSYSNIKEIPTVHDYKCGYKNKKTLLEAEKNCLQKPEDY